MASKNLKMELLVPDDGSASTITVYPRTGSSAGQVFNADSTHPLWDQILAKSMADDPSVVELFDVLFAIGQRTQMSERVSYAKGRLFLDDEEMHDGLSLFIVDLIKKGEDADPFIRLLENIAQNPSANSRKMLGEFFVRNRGAMSILPDGILVLYKSVNRNGDCYESTRSGPAIVNGVPHKNGYVKQRIGDVVSMPRSEVKDDPRTACSTGLHVGPWAYVGTFSGNVKLEVHVHPRDVVNVPSYDNKMRVCRYKIVREVKGPYKVPVLRESPQEPQTGKRAAALAPSPQKAAQSLPEGLKHPSKAAFNAMKMRARGARKGMVAYATTGNRNWILRTGTDGSAREHWILP